MTDSSLYCHARVGEGKENFQFPLPSWRKKFLVKQALTLRYAAKPKERPKGYDTATTKTRQRQISFIKRILNYFFFKRNKT
ncbi:MAG: hypothetical protein LBC07_05270 [Elusimicrobiota bacterium]|nr:hypothetical protein [Elusimicrobiota bacterium]